MKIIEGEIWHTFTTTLNIKANLETITNSLMRSELFTFCLSSNGYLSYMRDKKLLSYELDIEFNHSLQGMRVENHYDFIKSTNDVLIIKSFSIALNLHLSENKTFFKENKFPGEHVRLFMPPCFIKTEIQSESSLAIPYISIYKDNTIQVNYISINNLNDTSLREAIDIHTNIIQNGIDCFLCDPKLAYEMLNLEHDSKNIFHRRISTDHILSTKKMIKENLEEIELFEQKYNYFNCAQGERRMNLSDITLNIIDTLGNIIRRSTEYNFLRALNPTKGGIFRKGPWRGRPNLYINKHTNQMESSILNWQENTDMVDCFMSRVFVLPGQRPPKIQEFKDSRALDDYNYFYSEAITLVICSSETAEQLEELETFKFENVITDCHVKNEFSALIVNYYDSVNEISQRARSNKDILNISLNISEYEESILTASHRSGETYDFIQTVKSANFIKSIEKHVSNKLNFIEKYSTLLEQKRNQTKTFLIAILFGVIASGTLSNDLTKPVLDLYHITLSEDVNKAKIYQLLITYLYVLAASLIAISLMRNRRRKK